MKDVIGHTSSDCKLVSLTWRVTGKSLGLHKNVESLTKVNIIHLKMHISGSLFLLRHNKGLYFPTLLNLGRSV